MVLPLGQKYALAFSTWLNIAKCMGFLCQYVPMVYLSALDAPETNTMYESGKTLQNDRTQTLFDATACCHPNIGHILLTLQKPTVFFNKSMWSVSVWANDYHSQTPRSSRFLGRFPNPHHDESMRCFPSSHLSRMKIIKGKLVAFAWWDSKRPGVPGISSNAPTESPFPNPKNMSPPVLPASRLWGPSHFGSAVAEPPEAWPSQRTWRYCLGQVTAIAAHLVRRSFAKNRALHSENFPG